MVGVLMNENFLLYFIEFIVYFYINRGKQWVKMSQIMKRITVEEVEDFVKIYKSLSSSSSSKKESIHKKKDKAKKSLQKRNNSLKQSRTKKKSSINNNNNNNNNNKNDEKDSSSSDINQFADLISSKLSKMGGIFNSMIPPNLLSELSKRHAASHIVQLVELENDFMPEWYVIRTHIVPPPSLSLLFLIVILTRCDNINFVGMNILPDSISCYTP